MPLAATHRNFKRNRCLGDGSDSQLRARLAARAKRSGAEWGGVGRSGVCCGSEAHHGTQWSRSALSGSIENSGEPKSQYYCTKTLSQIIQTKGVYQS